MSIQATKELAENITDREAERATIEAVMDAQLSEIDALQIQIAEGRRETRRIALETQVALSRLKELLPDPFEAFTNIGQENSRV